MSAPTIALGAEGVVVVSGELTFATVTALHRRSLSLFAGQRGELRIDLGGVSRADSAGVALLIEWMRWARHNGGSVQFCNLPQQLRTIARASDLDGLLPVAG